MRKRFSFEKCEFNCDEVKHGISFTMNEEEDGSDTEPGISGILDDCFWWDNSGIYIPKCASVAHFLRSKVLDCLVEIHKIFSKFNIFPSKKNLSRMTM